MRLNKLKNTRQIEAISKRLKRAKLKIVFTNGCFDLLHPGHVRYLNQAKKLGDILVVGLNSDSSVRKIKGKSRPIFNQKARAELLSAIEVVDYIVIFKEDTPLELISAVKPSILVKGGDWGKNNIVGSSLVSGYGGKVYRASFIKGYSTTNTIKKIASKFK